jgi:hypothetical protein
MTWIFIGIIALGVFLMFVLSEILDEKDENTWASISIITGILSIILGIGLFCNHIIVEVDKDTKVCIDKSRFDKGDVVTIKGLDKKFIVKEVDCSFNKMQYVLVTEGLPEIKIEEGKLD